MHAITDLLKILARHLHDHQAYPATPLNLNSYLKAEADLKHHRSQTVNNHMTDTVPPLTLGASCTTTFSSGVCITDKMNMNKTMFPPSDFYFMTKKGKQYKTSSLSTVPTLQTIHRSSRTMTRTSVPPYSDIWE